MTERHEQHPGDSPLERVTGEPDEHPEEQQRRSAPDESSVGDDKGGETETSEPGD